MSKEVAVQETASRVSATLWWVSDCLCSSMSKLDYGSSSSSEVALLGMRTAAVGGALLRVLWCFLVYCCVATLCFGMSIMLAIFGAQVCGFFGIGIGIGVAVSVSVLGG